MRVLRAGLFFLTCVQAVLGLWILLLPRTFFAIPWVSMHLPYNPHLLLDYGAQNLAMAVVLGAALITMRQQLICTALVAYLVFSVAHLVIHATLLGHFLQHFSLGNAVALMASLVAAVVLPLALLVIARPKGVRNAVSWRGCAGAGRGGTASRP